MKAKKILTSLAIFLISGFIIIYIMIQLISGISTDVVYEYTTEKVIEESLESTGYLLRNEDIIYAENEGVLSYSVSEFQKVGVDQLIATVYASSHGVDIQQQIDRLDEKSLILSRAAIDSGYQTSDISKIDEKIFASIIQSRSSLAKNDLSLISQQKEDLLINLNKRMLITSGGNDFSEEIAALQNEKNNLTGSLQTPLSTVYAKKTGYFSTLLDGYETVYTIDKLQNLTIKGFDDLIQSQKVQYTASAIGKIITDYDWYTLLEVTAKEAETFQINKEYRVGYLYSSGEKLNAILEKKITQTDSDRAILILRVEEVPNDFDYTRKQTIQIVKSSVRGVTFPKTALRIKDGVQGVFVVTGNMVEFRKVEIIETTDSQYLSAIKSRADDPNSEFLTKHDRVITEGKDLYVGKILD